MSRAYRISVKESSKREVKGEDEISTQLEVLEILPCEQMAELMREELKKRGFDEQDDGTLTRTRGNTTVTVDPKSGEVSVHVGVKEEITINVKQEASGYDDVGPSQKEIQARLKQKMQEEIDQKTSEASQDIQRQASQELEQRLEDIQPELSDVINKVTREALKQKAQQMGSVKEIHEDESSGSLTIKIEV